MCVEELLNCGIEKSNKEQLYLEMEENVIIMARHKLLVKMSVNLFRTTCDREKKRELATPMWIYWVLRSEREMCSAIC